MAPDVRLELLRYARVHLYGLRVRVGLSFREGVVGHRKESGAQALCWTGRGDGGEDEQKGGEAGTVGGEEERAVPDAVRAREFEEWHRPVRGCSHLDFAVAVTSPPSAS